MNALRLLIVDDDPRMRESCSLVLDGLRIRMPWLPDEYALKVLFAGTAEEAKGLIETGPVDLLLLDQRLPGMQGTDLLAYIVEKELDLQTVMITGNASLDTAVNATRNGASEILAKPFTPEELRLSVSKAARFLVLQRIAAKLDEERKKTRFEFISVLSHELKSPLAAVTGYLDMLRNRTLGDDLAAYDACVERSILRLEGMRRLIIDMLDLTRIESGVKVRTIAEHHLADIAGDLFDGVRAQAAKRGVTLTQDLPDVVVKVDRVELEIVINNLLTNAIKYNKEGGAVTLTGQRIGHALKLQCRDTGIGMTAEETEKLFKEFTRIRNENTKNILGNGLGLSIVKKIVALYDGEVSVESRQGEGSVFTVILPGIIT
ncbi:MAG TPA: ATP-binding protein [bacterium]|nr:ATP-binding protein [bacterium]